MGLKLSMLMPRDKVAKGAGSLVEGEMVHHSMPRIAFFGCAELSERLADSCEYEFIPYGKINPATLNVLIPSQTAAIVVHFEAHNATVSEFVEAASRDHPEVPCFILCNLNEQKEISQYVWQVIAVRDIASLSEITEKLQRALFLFPWLRCALLRKLLSALKTIPAEAASHQRIVRELQNPQFSLEHIAKLIKQDPALTAQLLKIVNSAAFLRGSPVQSVNDAVSILGAAKLQALIAAAWAFFLIDDAACEGFHPKNEWQHAGDIAERVRKMCESEGADTQTTETAIIAALLHDLGKFMLAANLSQEYAKVLQLVADGEGSHCQVENHLLGFNHAEVGGCLLALWGVPLPVAEAVMNHHADGLAPELPASLIQRAHVQEDDLFSQI